MSRRRRNLPQEIIEDILVKLPVKSIIRFKSVSKSWFHLIKSNRFIYTHLMKNEQSFPAICFDIYSKSSHRWFLGICQYDETSDADYKWPVLNFEVPPPYRSFRRLAGNCNGILCYAGIRNILLVNPSFGEVKLLPILPVDEDYYCRLVGFGFDNTTNDFKVVRIMSGSVSDDVDVSRSGRVEIYDLRSNAWRKSDEIPIVFKYASSCSTFFNGFIHWCVNTPAPAEQNCWRILSFNVATELFHQIELPQGWCNNERESYYRTLCPFNQESLAFVSCIKPVVSSSPIWFVNVWKMNEHGHGNEETSWTKLYSIGPLTEFRKPISFSWKKHKFLYKTDKKLILYDLLDQSSYVVCDDVSILLRSYEADDDLAVYNLEMEVFKSCLVSIKT